MTNEEREKRNARRRKDPNRPLEWVMLFISTTGTMLEVSPKQCQDCVGMFKYLAMHPQMGNRIPGAATWGKEKCMRMLQIRGRIAADCPLFRRENGDIICTAWPLDEVAQVIETRITNSQNAKGGEGGEGAGDRMHDRPAEKRRYTTFSSISKAGPSAGAMGPGFDGDAHPDSEPATDEAMQAALDEMKRD